MESGAMARRDALDGASTAAREGACASPFLRVVRPFFNPTTRLHFDASALWGNLVGRIHSTG